MLIDTDAWLGSWPFRSLRDNTADTLVARLDRAGISHAVVASIDAVFHRNPQPANEKLAEAIEPFADRLVGTAVINPTEPRWEDDVVQSHENLGLRGIRLLPIYHDYAIDGPEARRAAAMAAERSLSVAIPFRLEDERERHAIDPGKTADMNAIARLIEVVPEAAIIVSNARGFQNSDLWQRGDLREREWYVDLALTELYYGLHRNVSSLAPLGDFFENDGTRHLLFGTHLPFSYAGCALVKRAILDVNEEWLDEISFRSAARLFGIPTPD